VSRVAWSPESRLVAFVELDVTADEALPPSTGGPLGRTRRAGWVVGEISAAATFPVPRPWVWAAPPPPLVHEDSPSAARAAPNASRCVRRGHFPRNEYGTRFVQRANPIFPPSLHMPPPWELQPPPRLMVTRGADRRANLDEGVVQAYRRGLPGRFASFVTGSPSLCPLGSWANGNDRGLRRR
jgi:hypothetical protein